MSLNENPIFLTQKRLIHRSGVLAAVLIAALIGLSLFSGLIAYLARPARFGFASPQMAGTVLYAWAFGVETLILVVGGFSRITTVLGNERKAGLWDSNRLTPLKPRQIVVGYWLGAPLREFYMSVVLAVIGLLIVVFGKLSVLFWLETQTLLFTTALFLGLLAVLLGLTMPRPQNGFVIIVAIFFAQMFSFSGPKLYVTDFLLPVYAIANLFVGGDFSGADSAWTGMPAVFGLHVYPVLLTVGLQALVAVFCWRIAIRKTANPFQPSLLRGEIVALFAILVGLQHGLIWQRWHGSFGFMPSYSYSAGRPEPASDFQLAVIHCGVILLALIILGLAGLQPERMRIKAMRLGIRSVGEIFLEGPVSLAFALTVVAAIALFTQFVNSLVMSWEIYLIVIGNLLSLLLIFSLLLEFCRLRHGRHAAGFVTFWLFLLCVLPMVLAGVFGNSALVKFSPLAPGCAALADSSNENLNRLLAIVAGHLGIAFLLFILWRDEWKKLLARAGYAPRNSAGDTVPGL